MSDLCCDRYARYLQEDNGNRWTSKEQRLIDRAIRAEDALSGTSTSLAEHDAKVRAKERDACYFADPGKPPTERADYCAGWYAALDHKCATIRALGDAPKEKRGEWDRLHARIAELEQALAAHGKHNATCPLSIGNTTMRLRTAALAQVVPRLAEHDAQTRADEREACAKVCDEMAGHTIWTNWRSAHIDVAAAIRARGEKETRFSCGRALPT